MSLPSFGVGRATRVRWNFLAALMTLVACGVAAAAADKTPILIVPNSKSALHVTVPQKVDRSRHWQLVDIVGSAKPIRVQAHVGISSDGSVDQAGSLLSAIIPAQPGSNGPRRFRLEPAEPAELSPSCAFHDRRDAASLRLLEGESPVLTYHFGTITDEGVPQNDHRRSRACYVHPLWGLSGEILTDDFPKDHYHHHGVFWTWPHVGIDGKEYDLWAGDNIHDRFVQWLSIPEGWPAAQLGVENGWFVDQRKVMIERVWMRVFAASDEARVLDLDFTWIAVDRSITLRGAEGKSYGGLTVRFAPRSRPDTSITVPSGVATDDLPDTPLAWADFTSRFGTQPTRSGGAIFVPPEHPDFPPTWLTRYYGPLCVGWPGVNAKTFQPGAPIRLRYRIWIHKGGVDVQAIKDAYDAYTAALQVKWEDH